MYVNAELSAKKENSQFTKRSFKKFELLSEEARIQTIYPKQRRF